MKRKYNELDENPDLDESDEPSRESSDNDISDGTDNSQEEKALSDFDLEELGSYSRHLETQWKSACEAKDFEKTSEISSVQEEVTEKMIPLLWQQYREAVDTGAYEEVLSVGKRLEACGEEDEILELRELDGFPKRATPLLMAVIKDNFEKAKKIVEKDWQQIFVSIKESSSSDSSSDSENEEATNAPYSGTALHFASYHGHEDIVEMFIQTVKDKLELENEKLENEELQNGVEKFQDWLKDKDSYGRTALHFAVSSGSLIIAQLLIKECPELAACPDDFRRLPFYYAVAEKKTELVKFLFPLWKGNINKKYKEGKTLLHMACENGDEDTVEILLSHKNIQLNLKDANANTPLRLAILEEHEAVVEVLCQKIGNDYAEDTGVNEIVSKEESVDEKIKYEIANHVSREFAGSGAMRTIFKAGYEETFKAKKAHYVSREGLGDPEKEFEVPPLHLAIQRNQVHSVKALLDLPATNIELLGNNRERAIQLARQEMHEDQFLVLDKLKKEIEKAIRRNNKNIGTYINRSLTDIKKLFKASKLLFPTDLELPSKKEVHLLLKKGDLAVLEVIFNTFASYEDIKIAKRAKGCVDHILKLKADRFEELLKQFDEFHREELLLLLNKDLQILEAVAEIKEKELFNELADKLQERISQINHEYCRKDINDKAAIYLLLRKGYQQRSLESTTGGPSEAEESYHRLKEKLLKKIHSVNNTKQLKTATSPIMVFPRGINFLVDRFSPEKKQVYLDNLDNMRTFYCASAYRLAGYEVGDLTADEETLREWSQYIAAFIEKLKKTKPVRPWWGKDKNLEFPSLYYAIQQRYTNCKDGYDKIWNELPADIQQQLLDLDPLAEKMLENNIFVSASILIRHALRYAFGLSFADSKLEYLANARYKHDTGKAKYFTVGVLFLSFLTPEDYKLSNAVNVTLIHAKKIIKARYRLLNETEVTFPASLKNIEVAQPILLPSFDKEYSKEDLELFGLTKKNFQEYKKIISSTNRHSDERITEVNKLTEHLLDHYERVFMDLARGHTATNGHHLVFEYPDGKLLEQEPTEHSIKKESHRLHISKKKLPASKNSSEKITKQQKKRSAPEVNAKNKKKRKITAKNEELCEPPIQAAMPTELSDSEPDFFRNDLSQNRRKEELEKVLQNFLTAWEQSTGSISLSKQLVKQASKQGYGCVDVRPDGKCFFHAVLHQLHQQNLYQGADVNEIIHLTVNYLLTHLNDYEDLIRVVHGDINEFFDALSRGKEWADNIAINALVEALQVKLEIVRSDGSLPNIINPRNSAPITTLHLGYEVGVHYQSLVPKKDIKHGYDQFGFISSPLRSGSEIQEAEDKHDREKTLEKPFF